jgi:hypothetical protein
MTEVDQDYGDDDVNLIDDADAGSGSEPAPTATSVLDLLVTSLVDDPDAVRIDPIEQRGRVRLEVRVGPRRHGPRHRQARPGGQRHPHRRAGRGGP